MNTKQELSRNIKDLIEEFYKNTGVSVKSIEFGYISHYDRSERTEMLKMITDIKFIME